uniref:Uncharacterized protein n=1 Tax=Physcomitrium patens TaxID=3218 RepID=A0A2K1JCR2_PHYPA|nr:hypothetical protein PHYPA_019576 [Physcomitrium patens]
MNFFDVPSSGSSAADWVYLLVCFVCLLVCVWDAEFPSFFLLLLGFCCILWLFSRRKRGVTFSWEIYQMQ